MYFRLALKLVRNSIARSSERTYQGHFGAWAEFRLSVGKTVFLASGEGNLRNVWSLFEYVAYACMTKGLQAKTVESLLSAITYYHRGSRGIELQTTYPLLVNILEGVSRSHVESGNQQRLRRPMSWSVLLAGEPMCASWGVGG